MQHLQHTDSNKNIMYDRNKQIASIVRRQNTQLNRPRHDRDFGIKNQGL